MSSSVRGRRWVLRSAAHPPPAPSSTQPPLIERLLALRGIDGARAHGFLHGDAISADPMQIPGMPQAVARIRAALRTGERIAVYGDYDVDGVTATAILLEGIGALGGTVLTHIPNRFTDGYGLTRAGIRSVRDAGASLVVSVDCGINANAEIDFANEIGLGVVILDHHEPPPVLPDADAIVDPKMGGGPPEYDGLASCGLAYTVLRALYEAEGQALQPQRYLDLAALGTVADMVPLLGENRRIVRDGIRALKASRRPGVVALLEAAGIANRDDIDAEAIGYRLAPRINAAGRLEHAALALELLTTSDAARAAELARKLSELNARRQAMTEEALVLARALVAEQCAGSALIMVGHQDIAQGIVGLVAGKLAEDAYRPAIVYERGVTLSRGSARSIPELDMWRCLSQGDDLLERWGGHSQAGGFTVATANLPALKDRLSRWVERQLEGFDLQPALTADLEYPLRAFSRQDIAMLPSLEPCGQENPKPVFISRRVPVMKSWTVGTEGRHLRLKLRDGQGAVTWDAVGFGLGHALPRPGTAVDLIYTLGRDRRGMSELHLQDFAPAF